MVMMAIAQVNHLKFASTDNLLELPNHLLANPTAKLDAQILCLQRATIEDDPTQVHDWYWTSRMGSSCDDVISQYVQPINPSISVQQPGKPTFLFKSDFLVTLSSSLLQELAPQDQKNLLKIKCSKDFPYQSSGMSLDFIP
jgi:hypothetical protein